MNQYWNEIKQVLKQLGCLSEVQLNPGTSVEVLQDLEKHLSVELPTDLKELLLHHNGQADGPGLIYGYQMLSAENIRTIWDSWRSIDEADMNSDCAEFMSSEPEGVIKPLYTNPKWVPFAHDHGGNHIGIDYDPDLKGVVGQIISFGRDEDQKQLKANTFTEFIENFVKQLPTAKWNGEYLDW